jgi:TetR/AcrR family transcriptional repressor of nem operon
MRITKEKAAENRAALVQAAARLFRKHGIDGVGVAEISKEAGLTHGALYAHFPSKEALAAEALSYGLSRSYKALTTPKDGETELDLADLLDAYLSAWQRDNVASGCAMAASASEIGRQDTEISARFTDGFQRLVEVVEGKLTGELGAPEAHHRALTIAAAMIGGIAVARATHKANAALSDEILAAARSVLGELGGAAGKSKPRRVAAGTASPARRKKPAP